MAAVFKRIIERVLRAQGLDDNTVMLIMALIDAVLVTSERAALTEMSSVDMDELLRGIEEDIDAGE